MRANIITYPLGHQHVLSNNKKIKVKISILNTRCIFQKKTIVDVPQMIQPYSTNLSTPKTENKQKYHNTIEYMKKKYIMR